MAKKVRKADMPCNKPRKSWRAGKKKVVKAYKGAASVASDIVEPITTYMNSL